jgi:hypothetical protein
MASFAVRPLNQIIDFLEESAPLLREKQILAGFDGFIDTIVKTIRHFGANGECEFFETITEFGRFISGHSHKSTSIQYEILQRKPGGNMPNFVMALDALSVRPVAIGMLSAENGNIDPLFAKLGKHRYSYMTAGLATPFEFKDGKIFFSSAKLPGIHENETLFARIENVFPEFSTTVAAADLTAFLNWSELPFAQDLWEDIYTHALEGAKKDKGRFAFFDLCDTGAKNTAQIKAVISLLEKISGRRRTILSLNKNEALDIAWKILEPAAEARQDRGSPPVQSRTVAETVQLLFQELPIDELVVHLHTESFAFSAGEGMVTEKCAFNENPKTSTGAGDHFNAAYCYASLAGLPLAEKLVFANAYSGAYIASGSSQGIQFSICQT